MLGDLYAEILKVSCHMKTFRYKYVEKLLTSINKNDL